jgi:hypothetical protein
MKNLFKTSSGYSLLLLLGTAGWLYCTAFALPGTPIFQGDSSPIFLHEAVRMLHGEVIYKNFFEPLLPATQFFYLGLFKLIGVRSWIPDLMLIFLGTGLAWALVALAKPILEGKLVYLPSILLLGFAFTTEPDATHHWYSTLLVLVALVVIIEERSRKSLAVAGALAGVATLFTPTRGPAAILGITLFLFWERSQKGQSWLHLIQAQASLWLPFLVTTLTAIVCLIEKAGFHRFFYCTVTFLFKYYPLWFWNTPRVYLTEVPSVPWPLELPAVGVWLSVHMLLPLVYLLFLVRWWQAARIHPGEPWDRLMLLASVGLCLFLSISTSPSWLRLCSVSPPALVLLAWLVRSSGGICAVLRRLLWGVGAALMVAQPTMAQTGWRADLRTPIGREAFLDPEVYGKFRWVAKHTRPGDFFYQASDCNLYYLLDVRNPTQVPFLTASGYTPPGQVQDVVADLGRSRPRYVLWSVWLDVPYPGNFATFDGARLSPVREYLRTHYHLAWNFGEPDYEQVWERSR